ncbi:MAG: SdrD B-like domain-containing protein [Limisphaerales bacterium]
MKTWLTLLCTGLLSLTAFGQGTILFSTRITPLVDARIYDVDGTTPLSGTAFKAQIYAGSTANNLTPAGDPLPFRSDAGAGYVDSRTDPSGGVRIVPGIAPLRTAYVQVRAWDATKGATYEAAQAAGARHGQSGTITIVLGGDLVVPASLIGLQGFRLQVTSPPSILQHPRNVTTGLGGTVQFEVTTGGSSPFTYQWRRNNVDIQGAQSRVLTIAGVTANHAGNYSVRVSNAFGSVESASASLVIAPLPVITDTFINPQSPLRGRPLRLEVVVQGDGPITYQWRLNGINLPGANQSYYDSTAASPGTYSVLVTGPGGSIHPDIATVPSGYSLSLVPLGGGTISPNPAGTSHTAGTVVTLTAVADHGYRFSAWNGALSGNANPATIVMNDHKSVEAVFVPVGGTVLFSNRNLGQGLDARVFDTDGVTPLSGPNFVAQLYAGPTAETLEPVGPTVPFLTDAGAGYFRGEDRSIASVAPGQTAFVQIRAWSLLAGPTYEAARLANGKHGANPPIPVVTGNVGNPPTFPTLPTEWASFRLQIGSAPVLLTQPKSLKIPLGSTARFEVQASGSEPLAYKWRKGASDIPNATGRILEIPNASAANDGSYSVRVSNSQGFVDSDPATLLVVVAHTLTLATNGPGSIVATPESSEGFESLVFLPDTEVTLQAIPEGTATFVRWEGTPSPSVNPVTVRMSASLTVTAVFEGSGDGGTVDFRNFGGGVDAPIFDTDGTTPLAGPAFLAQLYAGPSESDLAPVGVAVPFRTDLGAGYIDNRGGSIRVVPTVQPGGRVFLQIRAWDASKGWSFDEAVENGGRSGASTVISVIAGGGLVPPALPIGLASFQLRLATPPSIVKQPEAVLVGLGGKARFEVSAAGSTPLSFQWRKGASDIPGATDDFFEIPSVAASDAGEYSVRVSNPLGGVDSETVALSIAPPPTITRFVATPDPALVGTPLRIEATVEGPGPFTYQWRFNQADLPGARDSVLEIAAAQAGTYSLRVSGVGGSTTRDAITVSTEYHLTISVLRGGSVTADPARETYTPGTTVTLTAIPEPGYDFGGWSGDIDGSANPTSIVLNGHRQVEALFFPTHGTVYFVNRNLGLDLDAPVYDEGGDELASGPGFVAQLYAGPTADSLAPVGRPIPLLEAEGAGYFRGEDRSIPTVPPGGIAHVQVRAWELSAGETYEAAAAALGKHGSSPTLVVVTGNLGNPPTVPSFLLGLAPFELRRGIAPRIVTGPAALTVVDGEPATFTVEATGSPAPSYQWQRHGTNLPGATLPSLTFEAVTPADAGPYSVVISNILGVVSSDSALLTVLVPPTIQVLTPNPVVLAGNPAELAVAATGSEPLAYQWYLGASGDITVPLGSSSPTFTSEPLTAAASFWVRVSNAAGSTNSPTLPVTVQRRTQSIEFIVESPRTFGDPPVVLVASATSGLPVVFELLQGPGSLTADLLTLNAAGTIVVRASQPGNAIHLPAPPVEKSILVQKASAVVSLSRLDQTFDGLPKTPTVGVSPPGLIHNVTFDGSTAAPSAVGEYTVVATVDDPNYAGSARGTLRIIADVNLAGVVFDDSNGSGTRDAGETGLEGVQVRLLALDGQTELRSTTTDSNGAYRFTGVATASYYVAENNPAGYISTTPDLRLVALSPGTISQVHFGDQAVATLAGVVFEDSDADGIRDDGERGLADVTIRLAGPDGQRTLTTSADGSFQFLNLSPGPHTVEEIDPPGFFSTTPNLRNVSVSAGGAGSASFGDQAAGFVSGLVFEDRNGNGSPDAGENGIPNVSIRLSDGATQRTTRTDASGLYRFADVPPGTYTLSEIDPLGFTSTTPNLRTISFGSGGSSTTHFGDQAEATVGGVVFEDLDGNGLQDPSESGLAGVVLRLVGPEGARSTSTEPDGTYLFAGVQPGSYTVEETDPAGYTSSTPNTRAVSVASGGSALAHFGDQVLASISGVVFEDLNGNGSLDDGEPGVGGVDVSLVRASDRANVGETTTASNGSFLFANVPSGAYEVLQLIPSGYTVLSRNVIPASPARHANTPTDTVTKNVSLAEGGAGSASFGINVVRTLSGMVFNDLDGDGQPNPGEPGLGGITIEVRNTDTDALVASTSTAGDGLFVVPGLATGSYSVHHAPIPGFASLHSPAVATVSATTAAAVTFPVRATATASGRVFNDENGDGVRGTSEPGIGGARLTLLRSGDNSPLETQTANDGTFLLTGLPTGEWRIEVGGIPGFQSTTPASVTIDLAADTSLHASFGVQSEQLRNPSITLEPADLVLSEGGAGTLTASAQGAPPLEFQWLKEGTPIPGATTATLSFAAAGPTDEATYQLRVRNAYGTVLSRAARVTVTGATTDPYLAWALARKIPEAVRLPGQDADLDGIFNLLEFILGTDPLIPTPESRPVPVVVTRNGAAFLGYEIRTQVASAARLILESTSDFIQWTEIAARRESGGTDANRELIRVFDTEPLTSMPHRFVRLGVALQTPDAGPAILRVTHGSPVTQSFRITLEGDPGRTYAVEGSDDFNRWTLIAEVVATGEPLALTDDTLAGARYRFYRAVPR